MRKLTSLLTLLCLFVGTAWGQVYQKVPHSRWIVTAPNQSVATGNEGGVAFIKDENPKTFYHSNWGGSQPGKDGLQGFLIDMAEEIPGITKITYTGRSDNNTSGWARGVKIYLYTALPEGLPADLSTVAHADKNTLFENATVLGDPAFDNTTSPWADNTALKTAEFAEAKTARYVLFVMHSGHDDWLTCADFHVWQKVEGIVEDKPYFLKITNAKAEGEWYLDTHTPIADNNGNTIGCSSNKVATYFTMSDGYWRISTAPKAEGNFVSVQTWNAQPQESVADGWTIEMNSDGTILLKQHEYFGNSNSARTYLGGSVISLESVKKVYTDNLKENAVKIQLVELTDVEAAKENARQTLSKIGVGYPAVGSEARTTLQAAVDADDATVESINAAIETYKSYAQVQMPEVGKVYRLISAVAGFATKKAIYSDNVEARWQSKDDAAMNQLWAVQSVANGKVVLMNVADAMYPQKLAANTLKMLPIEKENDLTFLGDGQFKISNMHANGHGNGAGNNGNIINYSAGRGSATAWRFEEVVISEAVKNSLIGAVENTYVNSLLIEQEGLEEAVEAARANTDHAAALAGLVAAVATADAQYIDLGYFYMKSKSGQKYAYNNGYDLKAKAEKIKQSIFKLAKADATTFYIQSGNGLYAQVSSQSQQTKTAADQVKFTISKKADGYYVLRAASTDAEMAFWHQDGSSNIVGWRTAASDNSHWTFEAVETTDNIYSLTAINTPATGSSVTYNNEAYDGDKEVKQVGGFYVLDAAPVAEDFTVTASDMATGMTSLVEVNGNSLIAHAGYDGKNIYTLRCVKDNSYARYHSDCQLSADDETNMLTYEGTTHYESLFFVEKGAGDYEDYYTIRSVAAPTMYAYNLKTANENSKVAMKEAPAEGDLTSAYYWKISSFDKDNAGNITPYGGDAYGWNRRGGYDGKNHIGYWQGMNSTDDNKWCVRTVEEEFIPNHSVIGYPTKECVDEYRPYAQFVSAASFSKLKNASYDDIILPVAGKFYRIQNENATGYLSSGTGTGRTQFVAGIGEKASSIFYFTGNKLVSYTTGLYLAESGNFVHYTEAVGENAGTTFAFAQSPVLGKLLISFKDGNRSFYSNAVGNSNAGSKGATGEFYRFTVEEVKWLPVAMNKEVGYATLYSPVELGLNGRVKAYTGKIDGDGFELDEQTAVPANTGVVLELISGAEVVDNYVYLPVQDATVTVSENELKGTLADEYISESSYVLSKQTEGVGFYKALMNQESNTAFLNNGFRAYLPAGVAAARFLVFDFGTETGIDQLEGENGNVKTEVYDLSGRRVQSAQKGIFIVNGKKVIR